MSTAAYLDYNAGAPVRRDVIDAIAEALSEAGNPSSVHGFGRRARAKIERARASVATAVDADPRGVIFTSGGTEANALVLRGCGRDRLLASAIEHPSVLSVDERCERIPVGSDGLVDLDGLERLLSVGGNALVSVMAANNETGIIQPLEHVAKIAHAHGALLHCDAAQALGRIDLSLKEWDVDFLTLSAHKLGGPSGVGAVVLKNPDFPLTALIAGGGQERRLRGGTENLLGIVGFGVAAELAVRDVPHRAQILALRDDLEARILAALPSAAVIGRDVARLPNTVCVAVPGLDTRTQVMALDLDGIMVGAGSACSSGKMGDSLVLKAMGLEQDLVGSAIRISLGWASTPEHINQFMASWIALGRRKGLPVVDAAVAA